MDDQSLLAAWEVTLPNRPALGAAVLDRYGDARRRYHNRQHLREVLTCVEMLRSHAGDPVAVELAAWFHDAVYDVHRDDNEDQSAQLAQTLLTPAGLAPKVVAEVARLVRLTAAHDPPDGDANGAVLCDADLAILASPGRRYADYVTAVRAEYAHLDDVTFGAGRAAVLRRLLTLPQVFRTPEGYRRWEQPARANLARELSALPS